MQKQQKDNKSVYFDSCIIDNQRITHREKIKRGIVNQGRY